MSLTESSAIRAVQVLGEAVHNCTEVLASALIKTAEINSNTHLDATLIEARARINVARANVYVDAFMKYGSEGADETVAVWDRAYLESSNG